MILTKHEILENIHSGGLKFTPSLDGHQLQPHSVDLRLGLQFHIPKTWEITSEGRRALRIDPMQTELTRESFEKVELSPGQYFELMPSEYIVASTYEQVTISASNIMAVLYPRSTVNRRGLAVDLSGIIDVGYSGYLMIPIINNTAKQIIRIYPGERICQLVFQTMASKLDTESINMHGLQKARYHVNTKGFIGSKADSDNEIELIKSGKLDELKAKYKIT